MSAEERDREHRALNGMTEFVGDLNDDLQARRARLLRSSAPGRPPKNGLTEFVGDLNTDLQAKRARPSAPGKTFTTTSDLSAPFGNRGMDEVPAGVIRTREMARPVTGSTSQITATAESKMLLPADPNRQFLFLQNNDLIGTATISFGVNATLEVGIKLAAGGGGILLDNHVPTAAVFIIGSIAANSNITLIYG